MFSIVSVFVCDPSVEFSVNLVKLKRKRTEWRGWDAKYNVEKWKLYHTGTQNTWTYVQAETGVMQTLEYSLFLLWLKRLLFLTHSYLYIYLDTDSEQQSKFY